MTPTPTNVFYFADGRVLHAENPKARPEREVVRVRRIDYLSIASLDGYREVLFALESVEVSAERDIATYREILS